MRIFYNFDKKDRLSISKYNFALNNMNNSSFNDFSSINSNFQISTNHFQNATTKNLEIDNALVTKQSFPKSSVATNQKKQNFENGFSKNNRKGNVSFAANSAKSNFSSGRGSQFQRNKTNTKRQILSVSQILARANQKKQRKLEQKKRKKPFQPIIPPKSLILLFKDKPEKYIYNRRIIDYKHCGLLQRYIGLGGKILPRRQTKLTAKQQRYVAKTIKTARIMGLLPFVTKERSYFR